MSNPTSNLPRTTAARVRTVIEDLLGVEIKNDSEQLDSDLRADSLDLIEIVMDLEDAFGVEIPDEDAELHINEHSTVAQIVAYVETRVGA